MILKKSVYNISIPVIGGLLLFNSYSCKLIKLDEYECASWISDINSLSYTTKTWLFENHFLVDYDVDELEKLLNENNIKLIKVKDNAIKSAHFRILPTTYCNAKCEYCFEKNYDSHHTLTLDSAKQIVNFILNYSNDQNKINLTWFGGEPLLNYQMITYIVGELKHLAPGKIITSSMLTNGSLFNDIIIKELIPDWNLKDVQITLDGLEDVHNRVKNYKNNKYGFTQTIDNIHKLIDQKVKVTIRVNINVENALDSLLLIDFLYREFENKIHVYCSPLFSTGNYRVNTDEKSVMELESVIFKKLYDYHYLNPKKIFRRKYSSCGFATFDHYLAIDADGSIYKCCEAIGFPEISKVGTIWDDKLDQKKISMWTSPSLRDECKKCSYLPICMGGCKCNDFKIDAAQCFRYKNIIKEIMIWEFLKSKHDNN